MQDNGCSVDGPDALPRALLPSCTTLKNILSTLSFRMQGTDRSLSTPTHHRFLSLWMQDDGCSFAGPDALLRALHLSCRTLTNGLSVSVRMQDTGRLLSSPTNDLLISLWMQDDGSGFDGLDALLRALLSGVLRLLIRRDAALWPPVQGLPINPHP